jgi:peptidoglycan/LPS O-acetylase OafA/YrhL
VGSDRLDSLDGLRAIAAIAVVGFHTDFFLLRGGYVGVDAFFVLSGFLITSILVREIDRSGSIDFLRFYRRRAIRLWPALTAMLAAYIPLAVAVEWGSPARDALWAWLYLSDYTVPLWDLPDELKHTWSLAVEQHFYLLWPLFLVALLGLDRKHWPRVMLAGFAVATIWRNADFLISADWNWTYHRFDTRLSGLFLGAALALTEQSPKPRIRQGLGMAALSVLMFAIMVDTWKHWTGLVFVITAVELGTAALILCVRDGEGEAAKLLATPFLVRLGVISYGIYLWHYPVHRLLREHLPSMPLFVVVTFIAIGLAGLSYRFIEKPLLTAKGTRPVAPAAAKT